MRSVALETMIGLMIAIIAIAIVLVIIYSSGLMQNVSESISIMLLTFSAYFRIILISIFNNFMSIIVYVFVIVFALRFMGGGAGSLTLILNYFELGLSNYPILAHLSNFNVFTIAFIIAFVIFQHTVFPYIPLIHTTINYNVGTPTSKIDNMTLAAQTLANKIQTTWSALGGNSGDPLEGLDNDPLLVYSVSFNLKDGKTFTLKDVYDNMTNKKIPVYIFCKDSIGYVGQQDLLTEKPFVVFNSNPSCDSEDHSIQNVGEHCVIHDGSVVYIYYLDHLSSQNYIINMLNYKLKVDCPYLCGVGDINSDAIIVCVVS